MIEEMGIVLGMYEIPMGHMTDKEMKEVAEEMFCNHKYWPGDHLEAASPAEASFWPIHPTLDRLIQYRAQARPFTDMSWATVDTTCNMASTDCKGHNAYDATYFQATVFDTDFNTYVKTHLTNVEMRNAINPTKEYYRMSYLYNNFEWTHCEKVGVSFKKVENSNTMG